jgi:hypothetical protein
MIEIKAGALRRRSGFFALLRIDQLLTGSDRRLSHEAGIAICGLFAIG